ncbi:MAG: DUF4400 domain-containing protein [Methylophilaceae bacterium]|nr:DUF4400 domain-containing protein [Methylophilaceae bacterium]
MASNRNGAYDSNLAVAFLWPFTTLMWGLFIFVLLGCGAIILALFFAQYYWVDPVEASDMLFKTEAARVHALSANGTLRLIALTNFTSQWTYWLFFQATSLHDAMYAYFNHLTVNRLDQVYLTQFVGRNSREIYIAMNIIQVYGLRIGFLITFIPLLFLVYVIAGIDGLTERYIRRACAGRESADMYKIGKLSKLLLISSGITFYLCTPINLNPYWLIAILVISVAVGTRIQWQYYKKYL